MKFEDLDFSRTYSYADYLKWQFEETVELIRGTIFKMSPAPTSGHQQISRELFLKIGYFLSKRSCQIFSAPFDVRLIMAESAKNKSGTIDSEKIYTVVQPDICVICDPSKIDKRGCLGSPDWIIEILSPSTARKDVGEKFEVYEASGVREYWIVHPADRTIMVFTLDPSGKYIGQHPYTQEQVISPSIFPELKIDLTNLFPDPNLVEDNWAEYMEA